MIDILFINPNSSKENYQALAGEVNAVEPPTWSLLLAQSCRKLGYSVDILDCNAERLTDEEAIKKIYEINPRLICFVTYGPNPNSGTCEMVGTIRLANKLRLLEANPYKPDYPTISIGSHSSALPYEVLREDGIDFVAINEGVYTLHDLINYIKSVNPTMSELSKVRGLGWKKYYLNQQTNKVQACEFVLNNNASIVPQSRMDIDLPGMAWDLLPKKEKFLDLYRCHVWHNNYNPNTRSPFISMYTSLGCRFKCSFCMINILNRTNTNDNTISSDSNIMRFWSTDCMVHDIDRLVDQGVTNIRLADEMFMLDKRFFVPLLEQIADRGYNLNMWAYARIDTVQEKYLDLFKRAGINWLALGIESANRTIRQEITKGKFQDIDIVDVCKKINNHGINVGANYIVGFPNEKIEHMQETLNLGLELAAENSNIYAATALPGSPLYLEAKQKDWELPQTLDGYGFLAYNHIPLRTNYLTAAEVLKFRDEAWHKLFESPTFLNKIEAKFGLVAKQHIEEINKIKLKRKILGD